MNTLYEKEKGQTVLEAVIVVGIVIVFVTGILSLATITLHAAQLAKRRSRATALARADIELVRSLRDGDYITFKQKTGSYCVDKDGVWTSAESGCPVSIDRLYSRKITLDWNESTDTVHVISDVSWHEAGADKHAVLETKLEKRTE